MPEPSGESARHADAEQRIRVLAVDDHDLFRAAARALLDEAGFEVVGDAATGEAALALARATRPDVVLMDLHMPGMGGVAAIRQLVTALPESRVLVFTSSADEDDVVDAIMAGAAGYVLKEAALADLARGIRAVAAGESLVSPGVAGQLLERVRRARATTQAQPVAELSDRDLAILRLLAEGKDNAEIARVLCLSVKTVKNNVTEVLRTLQVQNRTAAAVYAVRSGLA